MPASSLPAIIVRPACRADTPTLGQLGAHLVGLHHEFDRSRFIASTARTPDLYAGFPEAQRQHESAIVLIGERAGRAIGHAYATLEGNDFMALRGPAAVLHDLVVDPTHRRKDVDRLLVEAVRDRPTRRGLPL